MIHLLMMLSELQCLILVVRHVESTLICPGLRAHTSVLVLFQTNSWWFFTRCSNIHSSFYLPHNIEMKEAKRVCPLESAVNTAITQVIWPKLRHPAWFFYDLTWRQQEMERGARKKTECHHQYTLAISGPISQPVSTTRSRNLQCLSLIQNTLLFLVWRCFSQQELATSRLSGSSLWQTCLCFK